MATSSPSPEPTPTPAVPDRLVVTLDGLDAVRGGEYAPYAGEDLVGLLEEITGQPGQAADIEGPYGGVEGRSYTWDTITVLLHDGGRTSMSVRGAEIGGVPIESAEGITVGSDRSAVEAAGSRDLYDEDGDGLADAVGLGERAVPDTQSLSRPGEVGVEFVLVILSGGVVSELQSPGNDFSDI